ncbi:MAG: tRNA threonylcarbamoyladenosine dehydratase [Burkholderiaceae bacterium]|nr:tRNA threonylcarbamoyladenosine dehydratase [Burkholderiaceae bacterium]
MTLDEVAAKLPIELVEQTDQRRFSGLSRLYGVQGALRIRSAHVAVVGLGGVGSWAAEALARSGVGQITLIDLDHISESNINRQIHALEHTVGQAKVQAMRDRIAAINPDCVVHCIEEFVSPENWPDLLSASVDAVIDACDQIRAKVSMAVWAIKSKTIFVTVGAAGGKKHAHKVDIDDLVHTTHDPLLAQLRYRMRKSHQASKEGKKIGITCVFSREAVARPDASCDLQGDGSLNCHGYGSVVAVTATFGQCAAGWVIDKISEKF